MDDKDINIVKAAIEEIRAERKRRLEERVERGEVVRAPFCKDGMVHVVGSLQDGQIEKWAAERIAELRASGETREIILDDPPFMEGETEPILVIVTGVPRAGRD
jgi:hypothetical protein